MTYVPISALQNEAELSDIAWIAEVSFVSPVLGGHCGI